LVKSIGAVKEVDVGLVQNELLLRRVKVIEGIVL
jgi:hypothetical protein